MKDRGSTERRMLQTALRRKYSTRKKIECSVSAEGDVRQIVTFFGLFYACDGVLTVRHHNTKVLAVDFVNRRITDFGYGSYSQTTRLRISNFQNAIQGTFPNTVPDWVFYRYRRWCDPVPNIYNRHKPAPKKKQTMFDDFIERMPWAQRDCDGTLWFAWDLYDERMHEPLDEAYEFLRNDQNWRYWKYGWDAQGQWVKKFIDEDARRRWQAREQKRQRTRDDLHRELPSIS